MKRQSKKNIYALIILILIVIGISYRIFNKSKINECHKYAIGQITSIKLHTNARGTHVEYFVDGERYTAIGKIYSKTLPIKKVPIIYPCSNPRFGQLLLTPNDFEEFNIPYPDSLKWVLQYIENK